jgi:hypothetical protein
MSIRALAALAALSAMGWAPAPFLKRSQPTGSPLGLWEVTSRGEVKAEKTGKTYILIEEGRWTFFNNDPRAGAPKGVSYHLRVLPGKLMGVELRRRESDSQAYGKGVLEVKGEEMRLSYRWGEGLPPPKSLTPPDNGNINFVLKRVKK